MFETNVKLVLNGNPEPVWFDNVTVEYTGSWMIITQQIELKQKIAGTDGRVVETSPFKAPKKFVFPAHEVSEVVHTPVATVQT